MKVTTEQHHLRAKRAVTCERLVILIKMLDSGLANRLLTAFVLFPDEVTEDLMLIEKEVFVNCQYLDRPSGTTRLGELLHWYRDKSVFTEVRPKNELAIFRETA